MRRAGAFLCGVVILLVPSLGAGQDAIRINRLIEALERGEPAITADVWTFVDQEHGPYEIGALGQRLESMAGDTNDRDQQRLAPMVRIPAEGDQDSRWIIKQVLERGAMGIIVPQVETAEQALRIVQAMRYPQRKGTAYPEPPGRRGLAGAPRTWGLSVLDYIEVADLWPLNPGGELFAMPMIETPTGVRNVDAILDVPGVGGVLIGPTDLSMAHGEGPWRARGTPDSPDTEAAIQTVAEACVAKQKYCGMVTYDDEETTRYIADGFRVIFAVYR